MKEIDAVLFSGLRIIKAVCLYSKNCSECPLSYQYNDDGDITCILQQARPCNLHLQENVISAPEGDGFKYYTLDAVMPEEEE